MHPKYVVWLEDDDGRIVHHELYFNAHKARRSYSRASKPDKNGLHELVGEKDSYTATSDVTAVMRFIGDDLSTKQDNWRKGFLNLTDEEEKELSGRLRLPVTIIREISTLEKNIAEKQRFYMHPHDEQTSALIRKYAPDPLARILRKIL